MNNNENDALGLPHLDNILYNSRLEKKIDYCGCCDGIKTYTPLNIENPPSLSLFRYKIGTHGMFKASMMANLSKEKYLLNLSKLTTREDNDMAIAIIDAWAIISVVITFYQERIANEGFLRTATERMSILELARSIGYELGSGVASDTFLSFKVEENNSTIEKSIIQIGTKVQSIPQQGEMPQTFETVEKIEASPELNEIKAKTKLPHTVDRNTSTLYFEGVDTKLKQDDMLLIINKIEKQNFKFLAKVLDAKTDEKKNITIAKILILWAPRSSDVSANTGSNTTNTNYLFKTTNFFDNNNLLSLFDNSNLTTTQIKNEVGVSRSKFTANEMTSSQLSALAIQKNVSENELINEQTDKAKENFDGIAPQVYVFRQKAAIFGHDAPSYSAITLGGLIVLADDTKLSLSDKLSNWDSTDLRIFQKVIIEKEKDPQDHLKDNFKTYSTSDDPTHNPIIFLDNVYENIISIDKDKESDSDNWVAFVSTNQVKGSSDSNVLVFASPVTSTKEETLVEYAVTGKATGIQLKTLDNVELVELEKFKRRNTTVFIQSERLKLAEKIDESSVQGNFIELDKGIVGLKKDQVVIITGEKLDESGKPTRKTGTEYRELREITTKKISLDMDLDNKYQRDSVKIYANVAKATHGETKREVLGSGDPSISQQSFILKQKPLTFIKAPTPTGASSTLEVRVDDILWKKVDFLYDANPHDQVFVSRTEDDGSTVIIFGDGKRGSRPFIGLENITAKYRIGTGKEGLLKQNQLSILMDKPLGVKSVTNPFPTSASEDPETLEGARANAPLKVLTMDRIVSLSDFENFVRCFAGIGKAKASEIWDGTKNIVHLSIASSSEQGLDSLTFENITRSIEGTRIHIYRSDWIPLSKRHLVLQLKSK